MENTMKMYVTADEAAQIYATVKDHPVDRDSYADVKAFLDRYAKDYQGQEDAWQA